MEIPTFQPSAFAWKWIMIINNKLSISRFTPTLFKKMWKSHRSLWLLWFTMPCDPSYACFTLVYVKRNLTEYMDRSSSINLPFDRRPATYLIHGKLWVVVTRFLSSQMCLVYDKRDFFIEVSNQMELTGEVLNFENKISI